MEMTLTRTPTIVDYIGLGRANATTREELCIKTGMSDREVRKEIARAREDGVPIVSSSHSAGYYIATTKEEKEIILREMASRIKKLAKVYQAINKKSEIDGQRSISDICEDAAVRFVTTGAEYLAGRKTK